MRSAELIAAFANAGPTPCETCSKELHCKTNATACAAFVVYVRTGRRVSPHLLLDVHQDRFVRDLPNAIWAPEPVTTREMMLAADWA